MTSSRWHIVKLATRSVAQFCRLVVSRSLHLRRDRLGERYTIDQGGTYAIFRETVCDDTAASPGVVLVVGFRLRVIHGNPALHWLFQRLCILTTPFWSGFRGFHVKLWMVDPTSKNYLGIYSWIGGKRRQGICGCPRSGAAPALHAQLGLVRTLSRSGSRRLPAGAEARANDHQPRCTA